MINHLDRLDMINCHDRLDMIDRLDRLDMIDRLWVVNGKTGGSNLLKKHLPKIRQYHNNYRQKDDEVVFVHSTEYMFRLSVW